MPGFTINVKSGIIITTNLLTSLAVAIAAFWYPLNDLSLILALAGTALEFMKGVDVMSGQMNKVSRGLSGAYGSYLDSNGTK